jgi:hypothetical protein
MRGWGAVKRHVRKAGPAASRVGRGTAVRARTRCASVIIPRPSSCCTVQRASVEPPHLKGAHAQEGKFVSTHAPSAMDGTPPPRGVTAVTRRVALRRFPVIHA